MGSSLRRALIVTVLAITVSGAGLIAPRSAPAAEGTPTAEIVSDRDTPLDSAAEVRLGNAFRQSAAYQSPNYEVRVSHGSPWAVRDVFSTEDPEGDPFDYVWLWNGTTHAEFLAETWAAETQAPDCADFWIQHFAEQETTDNFAVLDSRGGSASTWSRLSWDHPQEDGSAEPITMLIGCHRLVSGEGAILSMLVSSASANWDRDANARYDLFTGVCWNAPDETGEAIERCAGG